MNGEFEAGASHSRFIRFAVALVGLLVTAAPTSATAQTTISQSPRFGIVKEFGLEGGLDSTSITTVADALLTATGALWILDRGESRVRRYDRAGKVQGFLGRAGAGPGEFRGFSHAGWHGDSIWIHDPVQRRINIFSGERFVRSIDASSRLRPPHSLVHPLAIRGRGVQLGLATAGIERDGSQPDFLLFTDNPLTMSATPVHTVSRKNATLGVDVTLNGQPTRQLGAQPFSDAPIVASVRREGAVIVERAVATSNRVASFKVLWFDPAGTLRNTRTYSYQPVPLDKATRDEGTVLNRTAKRDGVRGASFDYDEGAMARALYLPTFLPPVQEAVVGYDGTLWLTIWTTAASSARTVVMIDENGAVRGQVSLPKPLRVFDSRDGRMVAGDTPWNDVNALVVYRLDTSVAGPRSGGK